jgi:pimeloyl-ACP methyl ester carboxylesterase
MSGGFEGSGGRTGHRLAAAAAGVGLAVAVRSLLPAGTPRIRPRPGAQPIARLETVRIGESDQWILVRSEDVGSPLVLFLHGGPGTSQLTWNRRNTRRLERYFTVVNWDQRGAGKSFAAIRDIDRMNIEQFVEDTRELTSRLLERFDKQRLVLVGHSWGSAVGALTVSRYPELYSAYVGIGQVVNIVDGERASYLWTLDQARRRGDRRAVAALEAMGLPPYEGDWQKKTVSQRRYLARYGGELYGSRNGAMGLVVGGLLLSREYTLVDRVNYFRGILGSMRLLWPDLLEVDLLTSVLRLDVPVFLVEGRHDHEAPAELAERYFSVLEAPSKELVWFERSAHLPNVEERARFDRLMVEQVLPIAAAANDR